MTTHRSKLLAHAAARPVLTGLHQAAGKVKVAVPARLTVKQLPPKR